MEYFCRENSLRKNDILHISATMQRVTQEVVKIDGETDRVYVIARRVGGKRDRANQKKAALQGNPLQTTAANNAACELLSVSTHGHQPDEQTRPTNNPSRLHRTA